METYTLKTLFKYLYTKENIYVICDKNVYIIYQKYIDKFNKKIIIESTEINKNLDTINIIYNSLIENNITKTSTIIGIGGGIITDITGYVASTFMRGTKLIFVPTTLLSMVDASIGGKNGVNYHGYKNLIGSFKTPDEILICEEFLKSLPQREYYSAYGEICKYKIGFDYNLEIDNLSQTIIECKSIKEDIVNKDFYETNQLRKKLNLGHTIAHIIEKYLIETNQSDLLKHGECVAIGLLVMLLYSYKKKYITNEQYNIMKFLVFDKCISHLKLSLSSYNEIIQKSIEYINQDKKSIDNKNIDIIIISNYGECKIITEDKKKLMVDILQYLPLENAIIQ